MILFSFKALDVCVDLMYHLTACLSKQASLDHINNLITGDSLIACSEEDISITSDCKQVSEAVWQVIQPCPLCKSALGISRHTE